MIEIIYSVFGTGEYTYGEENKEKEQRKIQRNVQIDKLVKKYCAFFGCPVYNI